MLLHLQLLSPTPGRGGLFHDDKPAMWKHMTEVCPDYDEYQTETDRPIPVVVFERT